MNRTLSSCGEDLQEGMRKVDQSVGQLVAALCAVDSVAENDGTKVVGRREPNNAQKGRAECV